MVDTVSAKCFDVVPGKEVCTIMCRLPDGRTETKSFFTSAFRRMTYLEAIGEILDTLDDLTGGLSKMEKHNLALFLRDYLMKITK